MWTVAGRQTGGTRFPLGPSSSRGPMVGAAWSCRFPVPATQGGVRHSTAGAKRRPSVFGFRMGAGNSGYIGPRALYHRSRDDGETVEKVSNRFPSWGKRGSRRAREKDYGRESFSQSLPVKRMHEASRMQVHSPSWHNRPFFVFGKGARRRSQRRDHHRNCQDRGIPCP